MSKAHRFPTLLSTICLVMTVPAISSATVLLPADFVTAVAQAESIVHDTVTEVRSGAAADRRTIETVVTVAVIESFKGSTARTVTFRTPGGQVGRYKRVMVGVPEFEAGDEVILLLHGRPPMVPTLFGLSQGVYRVARTTDGRRLVTPPALMARGVGAERVVRGDPARVPIAISDFAREVRAALGSPW